MKKNNIVFKDTLGIDEKYHICAATKCIPDWYKKTFPYINDYKKSMTIKKCMPVFDSMTAGYIIKTYVDIYVTQKNGAPWYEWPLFESISFHPIEQAEFYPNQNSFPFPKWKNPWSISTPKGYSCLFLPPMHNPNNFFTILPGIVDTDKYILPVELPFTLNNVKWEGIIPAGTPMAQVIPFKRDSFEMKIKNNKKNKSLDKALIRLLSLFNNSYKKQFWHQKYYK